MSNPKDTDEKAPERILMDSSGNLIDEQGRIIEAPTLKKSSIFSGNKKESIQKNKSKHMKMYDINEFLKEKRKDMHWDKELEKTMHKPSYAPRKTFDTSKKRQSERKDIENGHERFGKKRRLQFHEKGKFIRSEVRERVRNGIKNEIKTATKLMNQEQIFFGDSKKNLDVSKKISLSQIYLEAPESYEFTELQLRLGTMFLDGNFPGFHLDSILNKNDFEDLKLDSMQDDLLDFFDEIPMEKEPEIPNQFYEWWDYRLIDKESHELNEELISHNLIEHPPPIEPLEKISDSGPLPLYMTKEERKKLRKQTKMQRQKEIQLKIRVGLMPPPPPKANLKTFMRVHLDSGIQDPTELENKIRAEIAQRVANHEARNQANKLTKAQRKEKISEKARIDREKELLHSIYIIDNLSHPQQQFKINNNAQKLLLNGCVLQCKEGPYNIVIIEAGRKYTDKFEKLMCAKIKWNLTQNNIELKDLPENEKNQCKILWKGTNRRPVFKTFFWKKMNTLNDLYDFMVTKLKMREYYDLSIQRGEEIPTEP